MSYLCSEGVPRVETLFQRPPKKKWKLVPSSTYRGLNDTRRAGPSKLLCEESFSAKSAVFNQADRNYSKEGIHDNEP
jgi:hypothetical protein